MKNRNHQNTKILQTINMKVFAVICLVIATAAVGAFAEPIPDSQIEGRIISGSSAKDKQFPYLVAINGKSGTLNWWCGGSVISNIWILTSADCIQGSKNLTLYYGNPKLTKSKIVTTIISTAPTIYVHPKFNNITLVNNIGLIQTAPIPFSKYVNKTELPRISYFYNNTYAGEKAVFASWGATKQTGETHSDTLKYANFEVLSVAKCQETYGPSIANGDVICAATPKSAGPCVGDNGSPWTLNDLGRQVQIGIMSFWRFQDCKKSTVAGLTRVSSYLDWIRNVTSIYY